MPSPTEAITGAITAADQGATAAALTDLSNNPFAINEQVANISASDFNIINYFKEPLDTVINSTFVSTAFNVLSTIGCAILIIYFLIELEDLVFRQNFDAEVFCKSLIKFMMGIIIVMNIGSFLLSMDEFSTAIITDLGLTGNDIKALIPTFSQAKSEANAVLNNFAASEAITPTYVNSIVYFFSIAIEILLAFLGIKRAIEIAIYHVFSPIIYSDFFSSGVYGVAQKIKNVLSLYLMVPFILIVTNLGGILLQQLTTNKHSNAGLSIYLACVVLAAILKSLKGSKDELERFFSS